MTEVRASQRLYFFLFLSYLLVYGIRRTSPKRDCHPSSFREYYNTRHSLTLDLSDSVLDCLIDISSKSSSTNIRLHIDRYFKLEAAESG